MTTINIELPAGVPEVAAEDLRQAISGLLDAATQSEEKSLGDAHTSATAAAGRGAGKTTHLVHLLDHLARSPGGLADVVVLLENLSVREQVLRHVTDAVANQPQAVGPATAAQVAMVDQAWRDIQERYGTLDAGQYADLVGASPTSRSVASKARAKGLVGYRRGRKVLYPRFQFDQRGLRSGWIDLVAPLRAAGWEDEDIILWLAAPHGALGRRSPIEALEEGDRSLVLDVVTDEVAGIW